MKMAGNESFSPFSLSPIFHFRCISLFLILLASLSNIGVGVKAQASTSTSALNGNFKESESTAQKAPASKLEIPALGRSAIIGELYDEVSQTFLGVPIFKDALPSDFVSTVEIPWTDSEYTFANSLEEKRKLLKLSVDLTASIFFGLVKIRGSAEYLNDKVTATRAVSVYLNYETRSVRENIQPLYEKVQKFIMAEHLQGLNATHIVVGIEYGGSAVVKFEEKVTDKTTKESASGSLGVVMQVLMGLFGGSGDASIDYGQDGDLNTTSLSIKLFGDVTYGQNHPMNFSQLYDFISEIPGQIQKLNNGKGKPMFYTLFPLEIIRKSVKTEVNVEVPQVLASSVDSALSQKLLQIADRITLSQSQTSDLINLLNSNQRCITNDHTKRAYQLQDDFDSRVNTFKDLVKKLLIGIRSGQSSRVKELEQAQQEFLSGPMSPQSVGDLINSGFSTPLEKIDLCKTLINAAPSNGPIDYLKSPSALRNFHLKNSGKHVYVLFYSMNKINSDEETWAEQSTQFFKLAQNPGNKMAVMDCEFSSAECDLKMVNKIQHYKNGRLVQSETGAETEKSPKPIEIQIPALGTSMPLGALYNNIQGSFNGRSIFLDSKKIPLSTLTEPVTNLDQYILFPRSFYLDKLRALKIPLEKRLSILTDGAAGSPFFPMTGSLRWYLADSSLNSGSESTLSQFSSLVSHIRIIKDSLNPNPTNPTDAADSVFLNNLNMDSAISSGATHYVKAVYFGLTTIFQIPSNEDTDSSSEEIKKNLESIRTIFTAIFLPATQKNSTNNETQIEVAPEVEKQLENLQVHSKYKISFYSDFEGSAEKTFGPGDVKKEIIASLKELQASIGRTNDGKAVSVAYDLAPLSSLEPENYDEYQTEAETNQNPKKNRLTFLQHFEDIQNAEIELIQFSANLNENPNCTAPSVLSEVMSFSKDFGQRKKQWLDKLKATFFKEKQNNKENLEADSAFQELSDQVRDKMTSVSVIREVKNHLWRKFPGDLRKMDLCHLAAKEGVFYLGMKDSDTLDQAFVASQKANAVYFLWFRHKWLADSPERWIRALYVFFTELNLPQKGLYLVDCDSGSPSLKSQCDLLKKQEVTIQEYQKGTLTNPNILVVEEPENPDLEPEKGNCTVNSALLTNLEKQVLCVEKKLDKMKGWLRSNFTSTLRKTEELMEDGCGVIVEDSPYFGFSWRPVSYSDKACTVTSGDLEMEDDFDF